MPVEVFGHVDRRAYNPSRDVARLIEPLSASAIDKITTIGEMPGHVRNKLNVTEEELIGVSAAYIRLLQRLFDDEQKMLTLGQAFQHCGILQYRPEAQAILFLRLGQLFFSASYSGVLDLQSTDEVIAKDADILAGAIAGLRRPPLWRRLLRKVGLG